MKDLVIGVHTFEPNVRAHLDTILRAEELGIDAVWYTLGFPRPDPIPMFAAAAMRTSRIKLGTAIIPTYPRHPFALAQEARVVGELAPGRFRLGVGPSHKPTMEDTWGIPLIKPLAHLREYLLVLKAALQQGGELEFRGEFFSVRANCGDPLDLEIMASGLRGKSFELIGELADGGISWVCPLHHMERVAIPALAAGAARAGRKRPLMIMHLPICVHEDAGEVRAAAAKILSHYPHLPFYVRMFVEAGFPEAAQGVLSERMIDAIVAHGDEAAVTERIRQIAGTEVDEVLCSVIAAGSDPAASQRRALELLGKASNE